MNAPLRRGGSLAGAGLVLLAFALAGVAARAQSGSVPGQWGTEDTSDPASITWPASWHGERLLSCQWLQRFEVGKSWRFDQGAAQGEDIFASYFWWGTSTPMPEGTRILIEGDFPHARYFNFQVGPAWDPEFPDWRGGEGAPEIPLIDVDIVADPGSVNPYLEGADRNAANRHFHVTFELRAGRLVDTNPKAGRPPYRAPGNLRVGGHRSGDSGQLGPYVGLRIYAPDKLHPTGGVELPVIRIQRPGRRPELAPPVADPYYHKKRDPQYWPRPETVAARNPCLATGLSRVNDDLRTMRRAFITDKLPAGYDPSRSVGNVLQARRSITRRDGSLRQFKVFGWPRLVLARGKGRDYAVRMDWQVYHRGPEFPPPGNDEHVSGTDVHNSFLTSKVMLRPGEAVVIRARAPRTPVTLAGAPAMGSSSELRYWSANFYHNTQWTPIAVGGIVDEMAVLDRHRNYTLVISRKDERPRNARPENGITWVPSAASVFSIIWRFKSTSHTEWEHALARVPWEKGDVLLDSYDPRIVEKVLGEHYPDARYMSIEEVEALGSVGEPPYHLPNPAYTTELILDKMGW